MAAIDFLYKKSWRVDTRQPKLRRAALHSAARSLRALDDAQRRPEFSGLKFGVFAICGTSARISERSITTTTRKCKEKRRLPNAARAEIRRLVDKHFVGRRSGRLETRLVELHVRGLVYMATAAGRSVDTWPLAAYRLHTPPPLARLHDDDRAIDRRRRWQTSRL